jgi:hypothetical protein
VYYSVLQVIWVPGSFKRRRKKAHIKNMGTPLLLNFKIFGGALPQAQSLIGCRPLRWCTA